MGILGGTLSQLGVGFSSLGSVISGFAAGGVAGAAIAGVGEIVKGLQWATSEAAKSQQAWTDLQASLKLTGPAWEEARAAVEKFASSLQKTTVYQDEAIVGAVQKLSTFGMSYTQAMDAVKVAVDLAAAKHIDLETATGLVGKAFMGNTSILARYGIDVTTAKEATAGMKDAIGSLADGLKAMGPDLGDVQEYLIGAGVAITDSSGKMREFKDIATDLVGAFQEGKISAEDFSAIQATLGTNIDTAKLKASDFTGVMDQLNKQFGGEAAAQAQTYAGAQERLKNAMSDMGEKIGAILLPALAGITEAMIPLVDWFTQGIGKVQAWITEVSKMPEVKAATDAVSKAFQGLGTWLDRLGKDAAEILGPALQDLWSAFKDIGEALAPLWEALGELWAAFTDGQGSGNILKDILKLIADNIRAIAFVIKEVAPVIHMIADAFKVAADFISPIIATLRDTIGGFLTWLHDAFQGLYAWLVGGSLWQDMWNQVISVTIGMAAQVVSQVNSALFGALQGAFQAGMNSITGLWNSGLQGLISATSAAMGSLVSSVQGALSALGAQVSAAIGGFMQSISSVQSALGALGSQVSSAVGSAMGWISSAATGLATSAIQTWTQPAPSGVVNLATAPNYELGRAVFPTATGVVNLTTIVNLDSRPIATVVTQRITESITAQREPGSAR